MHPAGPSAYKESIKLPCCLSPATVKRDKFDHCCRVVDGKCLHTLQSQLFKDITTLIFETLCCIMR